MAMENTARLAVLIDADNAQASITEGLLAEVAKYSTAHVKRAYGDSLADLRPHLNVSALDRVPQGIRAGRVQHGAELGDPGHMTSPVGIADLALGELSF
jgi:hypothetical protein